MFPGYLDHSRRTYENSGPQHDPQSFPEYLHAVAGAEEAAPAPLHSSVHPHLSPLDTPLGCSAGPDNPSPLQKGVKFDGVG